MKTINLLMLLLAFAVPSFASQYKSGEEVLAAMHKKYDGKWYKTLTFEQRPQITNPTARRRPRHGMRP